MEEHSIINTPFKIDECSVIAHVSREQLTSEELERLKPTEVMELTIKSRETVLMNRIKLPDSGKLYSVRILRQMLVYVEDDTDDASAFRLKQLLEQVDTFDYFWLV